MPQVVGEARAGAGPGRDLAGTAHLVAFGAAEVLLDGGAAVAMAQQDGRPVLAREISVAPVHERDQQGIEVAPLVRQPIFVALPLAGLAVGDLTEQALVHQPGQPRAEDLSRRADDRLYVGEPPDAGERLAQHQKGPLLSDDVQGALDRAVLNPEGHVHEHMIPEFD